MECWEKYQDLPVANGFFNTKSNLEQPLIRVQSNNNVYPGKNVELKVTYRNVPQITVSVYENLSPVASVMRKRNGYRGKRIKAIKYDLPNPNPCTEQDTLLSIPMNTPGLYEYEISTEDERIKVKSPFSVSRLTSISRLDENGTPEVLVMDFESGHPMSQTEILCYNTSGQRMAKELGTVTTDKQGLAQITLPSRKQIDAVRPIVSGKDTASLVTSLSKYTSSIKGVPESNILAYLFTDRRIYRPGQTVAFKGIIYSRNGNELQAESDMKYTVILRDACYQEIAQKEFRTNEFGSFHGEFTLPKNWLNGNFTLTFLYASCSAYR